MNTAFRGDGVEETKHIHTQRTLPCHLLPSPYLRTSPYPSSCSISFPFVPRTCQGACLADAGTPPPLSASSPSPADAQPLSFPPSDEQMRKAEGDQKRVKEVDSRKEEGEGRKEESRETREGRGQRSSVFLLSFCLTSTLLLKFKTSPSSFFFRSCRVLICTLMSQPSAAPHRSSIRNPPLSPSPGFPVLLEAAFGLRM